MDSTNTTGGNGEAVATSAGLPGGPERFTPGPWGAYAELKSGGLHTIWTENENGDPDVLPKLIGRTCLAPGSEWNARLMASAPDLLAALRGMLESFEVLENLCVTHFKSSTMQGVVRGGFLDEPTKARAAIAKALGTEPGTIPLAARSCRPTAGSLAAPKLTINQTSMLEPTITKITIGRLYNLGSYEHVRYELTVEVPDGHSPATALIGMENLLGALNPKRPSSVQSKDEITRGQNKITLAKEMTDEDFHARYNYGGHEGTREEIIARLEKQLAEAIAKKDAWEAKRAKARKMLEDLGGAANWKDAKDDWEDDY